MKLANCSCVCVLHHRTTLSLSLFLHSSLKRSYLSLWPPLRPILVSLSLALGFSLLPFFYSFLPHAIYSAALFYPPPLISHLFEFHSCRLFPSSSDSVAFASPFRFDLSHLVFSSRLLFSLFSVKTFHLLFQPHVTSLCLFRSSLTSFCLSFVLFFFAHFSLLDWFTHTAAA